MPLQLLYARQTIRRDCGPAIDMDIPRVEADRFGRESEIEYSRSPRPEIRGTGRDGAHVNRSNPEEQRSRTLLSECSSSIVEPRQQVVEALGPEFQADELRRTCVPIRPQSLEQLFGANRGFRVDGNAYESVQPRFQKISDLVAVVAVRIRQEAQLERLPAFQHALEPQVGPRVLGEEVPDSFRVIGHLHSGASPGPRGMHRLCESPDELPVELVKLVRTARLPRIHPPGVVRSFEGLVEPQAPIHFPDVVGRLVQEISHGLPE